MSTYIIGHHGYWPDQFDEEVISETLNTSFISGKLTVDRDHEFFPSRSDQKIMRDDIKVGITSIRTLIESSKLTEKELENTMLFVANGSFVENTKKYLNKIPGMYKNIPADLSEEEKVYKLYRISPPLLALETLTNSSMSFMAQYTGIKSHNATFGNTSLASYHAISEASETLNQGNANNIIVSASNCAGGYSFLSNSSTVGYNENWKESAGGGNLHLSSNDTGAICKITHLKSGKNVPQLDNQEIHRNWESLIPDASADLLIHSGAFDSNTSVEDQQYCEKIHNNVETLFNDYGNMGASNILMSVIHGIKQLNRFERIDIVDRDAYGRESLIRIEKN